jgi:hypothetical protein
MVTSRKRRRDKDTQGVPGSPPIFQTILAKIDRAAVFVADLTICGTRDGGQPTPNPNVLIEYGWALKSLGYAQIIAVMNSTHGKPSRESMPFDLASFRYPITYDLPDGAAEDVRCVVRNQLAKEFERALKGVLESEEYKKKLPKQPDKLRFIGKQPVNGKARFREPNKAVGFVQDAVGQIIGTPRTTPVILPEGPAAWFRLMPLYDPNRSWQIKELKEKSMVLASLPWIMITSSSSYLQGEDGCGRWSVFDEGKAYSVAYAFNTGELWVIDASLTRHPGYFPLDESALIKTLEVCASFLDIIGSQRPYGWSAGMDGIQGSQLVLPNRPGRRFGACFANSVDYEGSYSKEDKAADVLVPFFEKVFDQCGAARTLQY